MQIEFFIFKNIVSSQMHLAIINKKHFYAKRIKNGSMHTCTGMNIFIPKFIRPLQNFTKKKLHKKFKDSQGKYLDNFILLLMFIFLAPIISRSCLFGKVKKFG